MTGVVYRPVMEPKGSAAGGGDLSDCLRQPAPIAKGSQEGTVDERSVYQRARDYFRGFFAGKPAEELRGYRQRLDAAREAIGRRPGQKSWLANQSAVYFWALAQAVELDEAMRRAGT